jgi:hypothetical protein
MECGWNPIGLRNKGRPKNRWRVEVINDVKKQKLAKLEPNNQREKSLE